MASNPVPQFALYGEHAPLAAELIHIELIETRSRLHHWHIAPHTHSGMFQVLVLLRGEVRASVDGAQWDCRGPVALTIHPAVVHGFAFSADVMGYVLTLDQGVLSGERAGQRPDMFAPLFLQPLRIDLGNEPGDEPGDEPGGEPDAAPRIAALLEQLLAEFDAPREDHDLLLDWLARAVLLLLLRQHRAERHADRAGRAEFDVFRRFRALVELHYLQQWSVARYARQLHMGETRLNRMCLRLGGKSAFEMAQQRLMLEARRKLMYLPGSVASIAYELGFQDPAYFSRAFKRATGMTPRQYRGQHGGAS